MIKRTSAITHAEGLKAARLLMVLSSISPLFNLWAIRGTSLVPDLYFISFCALMVIVPNGFLCLRVHTARKIESPHELVVGKADDHRDHILVYLFAMLLPIYAGDFETWRNLYSSMAALLFIVLLFWHHNMHYMNLFFAVRGYHVFTVWPPNDGNPLTGKSGLVLITRRVTLSSGDRRVAYRLSDTVYMEVAE